MSRSFVASLGIFLFTAAVYAVAGAGRIDMIDGQYRFEVTHNMLTLRSTQIHDRFLPGTPTAEDGRRYSPYSVLSSVIPVPLVFLARVTGHESLEREHFFFSMTSGLFAAATAALLFQFYVLLGVPGRKALAWTLVFAFATSMLPAGTTVFDQAQHGFFLLAAAFVLFIATRRESMGLAAAAGFLMAAAVNIKEVYAALVPALAVITVPLVLVASQQRTRAMLRAAVFVAASGAGVLAWIAANYLRFGDPLSSVKATGALLSPFGNPLIGIPGLLVSPGKGVLFYSPAIVLALWGLPRLLKQERRLGEAILAACVIHTIGMASLSFFGGDWCWGPRYLVPIMPLVALGFPMIGAARPWGRVIPAVVACSLLVQVMGISLDHHRFFYARSLPAFFWYGHGDFYFRESALLARPGELLESFRAGVPPEATAFRPGPYPALLTYAVFGASSRNPPPPLWMRRYSVFWQPRPWPLWMSTLAADRRPVNIGRWLLLLGGAASIGLLAVWYGLRQAPGSKGAGLRGDN